MTAPRVMNAGFLARFAGSLAIIAAVTFIDFRIIHVNRTTVALTFVLAVLGIATRWGLIEAITASIAGTLCFNYYFLPPIGTFTIADPQNWVALVAFLATSIVGSQMADSTRRRSVEALNRQSEMERLYDFSRTVLLTDASQRLAPQVAYQILSVFRVDGVAFYDRASDRAYRAGTADASVTDSRLKDVALQGTVVRDDRESRILLPVTLGGHVKGSLAIVGSISETAAHALANLLGIALERETARELANRAEAARENQELKSTLLDALAHEFKTPLTSVKAAASSMLSENSLNPTQRELLTVIDEETDRLSELVTEAIQMARIEAGQVELRKHPVAASDLIREALARVGARCEDRTIGIEVDPALPRVEADEELIGYVLAQIVGNALKYTPPRSPLKITARVSEGAVVVGVKDQGPGIPEHEQARIFDKFYRGRAYRERTPGTGMGLAIASEIVKAHGGRLWVESQPGSGATFFFALPLAGKEIPA